MRGPDVKGLQSLLARAGWYHGKQDGDYGPLTAQAVYRAKFWLGYAKPDKTAGDSFLDFLDGTARPSLAMKARRKKRMLADARKKKQAKKASLTAGQRVVQVALSQLGQTEHPAGSNKSKFSAWYALVGPWCAMFVSWSFVTAKVGKAFVKSRRYSYVPTIVADARAGRNGLMLAHAPASGVVVCFDWNRDGTSDHVGVCVAEADLRRFSPSALRKAIISFGALGAGDFWTVEGNTAVGNDSNGGIVMVRKRNRSQVQAFVKVAT
jgi:hypothetical protein